MNKIKADLPLNLKTVFRRTPKTKKSIFQISIKKNMEIYVDILHSLYEKKKIIFTLYCVYFLNEGKMTRSLLEHPVYNILFTLHTFNIHIHTT